MDKRTGDGQERERKSGKKHAETANYSKRLRKKTTSDIADGVHISWGGEESSLRGCEVGGTGLVIDRTQIDKTDTNGEHGHKWTRPTQMDSMDTGGRRWTSGQRWRRGVKWGKIRKERGKGERKREGNRGGEKGIWGNMKQKSQVREKRGLGRGGGEDGEK